MLAPWYAMAYVGLDRVAHRHGYALALHGSMARDLDLVAVPWTEDADSPEKLLDAICKFIVTKSDVHLKGVRRGESKPHGRIAYTIPLGHGTCALDLSIMPRRTPHD